jgi:hypothetical protein
MFTPPDCRGASIASRLRSGARHERDHPPQLSGEIVAATTADSFKLILSPAKPTLEIIRVMQPCFGWCDRHRDRLGNIVGVKRLDTRRAAWVRTGTPRASTTISFQIRPKC